MLTVTQRILLTLIEKEEMSYRDIHGKSKISPKTVRHHLNELIKRKLVREGGRKHWKRGKKLHYSITEKGKSECFRLVTDNLDESFKTIQKLGNHILSDPSRITEWRGRRPIPAEMDVSHMSPEEQCDLIIGMLLFKDQIYGPLLECYRTMHDLICQFSSSHQSRRDPMFIGFSKTGDLYMIPAAELKEKGYPLLGGDVKVPRITKFDRGPWTR